MKVIWEVRHHIERKEISKVSTFVRSTLSVCRKQHWVVSLPFLLCVRVFVEKTVDFSSLCIIFSTLTPPFVSNRILKSFRLAFFFYVIRTVVTLQVETCFCFSSSNWYGCKLRKSILIFPIREELDDNSWSSYGVSLS